MPDESQQLRWIELYQSALLELDHVKLAACLEVTTIAIQERLKELINEPGSSPERQAIRDAQQNLRVLSQEIESSFAHDCRNADSHSHPEMAGDYVACVDTKRRYVAVTDGVCRLLGYSRAELLRMSIDEITAPELRESVPEAFEKYVAQRGMEGVFVLLSKDGRSIAIQYQARVFPDGCMVARWQPLENHSEFVA
ncbi:MAG TPA: PAS domain S-box protein [Terriglobales bacterium]|nr:PAS domain S-box protein [Terriglobales bacterium]